MPNQHVVSSLAGIQAQLMAAHQTISRGLSNASKGSERETFMNDFLLNVLPPIYRFGTRDATDIARNGSGQLDVIVEYPFSPTLPSVGQNKMRLYLAESVAAVIEVKSKSARPVVRGPKNPRGVKTIAPFVRGDHDNGMRPPATLVGYAGWKSEETVVEHVAENPGIGAF